MSKKASCPLHQRLLALTSIACKGKAPPFDTFSGEDPEVCLDDWFPSLQRASTWNGWTEEEELMQLAGSLRGRALREWTLLPHSDSTNVRSGVEALRNRLESGVKAMAAQDFRHCAQKEKEGVSDFICRLEKTFCWPMGTRPYPSKPETPCCTDSYMKVCLYVTWSHHLCLVLPITTAYV